MEESLKAARSIHLIYLLICAATLALAISPDDSRQYDAALHELDQLRSLDIKGFTAYAKDSVDFNLTDDAKKLTERVYDLARKQSVKLHDPNLTPLPREMYLYGFDPVPLEGTIEEIAKYYAKDELIVVFEPNSEELPETLERVIKLVKSEESLRYIRFFSESELRGQPSPPSSFKERALIEAVVLQEDGEFSPTSAYSIEGSVRSLKGRNFSDWLRQQNTVTQLVKSINGREVFLPNLHLVWNEVRDKKVKEVSGILETRKLKTRREISLLDIPLREDFVGIASPVLLVVTSLYLLVHVKHIRYLHYHTESRVIGFPWVPYFSDWHYRIWTYGTLILVPLIVSTLLIMRVGYGNQFLSMLGWGLAGTVTLCGGLLAFEMSRLRIALKR